MSLAAGEVGSLWHALSLVPDSRRAEGKRYPLASLLATEQVCLGDVVSIAWDSSSNALAFARESEGALLPPRESERRVAAGAAAVDGRAIPLVRTFAAVERLPPGPRGRT